MEVSSARFEPYGRSACQLLYHSELCSVVQCVCPCCRYEAIMAAFGGDPFTACTAAELAAACRISFAARRPALINVAIDPFAGVESGNVHAFNQPSKM